jgi:hypothetical protein
VTFFSTENLFVNVVGQNWGEILGNFAGMGQKTQFSNSKQQR